MCARQQRRRKCGAVALVGFALVVPAGHRAHATNENRPRTPAGFVPAPCLQEVDRSTNAALPIEIAIPFEDTATTADELPDSRTFQFFATCRDRVPGERLPNWIDQDDAERALAIGAIESLPEDDDVLATSTWSSCTHAITAKRERSPISCDGTLDAPGWAASGAPPGAYIVHGYTFEPSKNLWNRRAGVIRVHDGDPAQAGPAAALLNPARDARAYADSPYTVTGCAAGPPGTTATVEWAPTTAKDLGDDAAWSPVDTVDLDDPVGGEEFELMFDPPAAAFGQAVLFRITATSPGGDVFRHHTHALLIVLDQPGESDEPMLGPGPDACRGEDETGGAEGGTEDGGVTGGAEACACSASPPSPLRGLGSLALLGLVGGLRRRRRPASFSERTSKCPSPPS